MSFKSENPRILFFGPTELKKGRRVLRTITLISNSLDLRVINLTAEAQLYESFFMLIFIAGRWLSLVS